jgi:hypothetical protein
MSRMPSEAEVEAQHSTQSSCQRHKGSSNQPSWYMPGTNALTSTQVETKTGLTNGEMSPKRVGRHVGVAGDRLHAYRMQGLLLAITPTCIASKHSRVERGAYDPRGKQRYSKLSRRVLGTTDLGQARLNDHGHSDLVWITKVSCTGGTLAVLPHQVHTGDFRSIHCAGYDRQQRSQSQFTGRRKLALAD